MHGTNASMSGLLLVTAYTGTPPKQALHRTAEVHQPQNLHPVLVGSINLMHAWGKPERGVVMQQYMFHNAKVYA